MIEEAVNQAIDCSLFSDFTLAFVSYKKCFLTPEFFITLYMRSTPFPPARFHLMPTLYHRIGDLTLPKNQIHWSTTTSYEKQETMYFSSFFRFTFHQNGKKHLIRRSQKPYFTLYHQRLEKKSYFTIYQKNSTATITKAISHQIHWWSHWLFHLPSVMSQLIAINAALNLLTHNT